MVMIRRELPQTRSAGRARRSPRRIKQMRILRFAATSTAVPTPWLRDRHDGDLSLRRAANVPHEAQELAADHRDDLVLVLARCGQGSIPVVQPFLRAPSDLEDRGIEAG